MDFGEELVEEMLVLGWKFAETNGRRARAHIQYDRGNGGLRRLESQSYSAASDSEQKGP